MPGRLIEPEQLVRVERPSAEVESGEQDVVRLVVSMRGQVRDRGAIECLENEFGV